MEADGINPQELEPTLREVLSKKAFCDQASATEPSERSYAGRLS